MARRRTALSRRQTGGGGALLTAAVVLLAAAACIWISPPEPAEVAGVFGHDAPLGAALVEAVSLPAKTWYIVDANGQAMAACPQLIEAEIIRESYGEPASVRVLSTEEVALRVTATRAQLTAMQKSADALMETFDTFERMDRLPARDAALAAEALLQTLNPLCDELDKALAGTSNPIVRGLSGLVGSCRESMSALSQNGSVALTRAKHASLVQQYEAYVLYLSGGV